MASGKIADALAKGAPKDDERDPLEEEEVEEEDPGDELYQRARRTLERHTSPETAAAIEAFVKACIAGGG